MNAKLGFAVKVTVIAVVLLCAHHFLNKRQFSGVVTTMELSSRHEVGQYGQGLPYDAYRIELDAYPDEEFWLAKGKVENAEVSEGDTVRITKYWIYQDSMNGIHKIE